MGRNPKPVRISSPACRFCKASLSRTFVDLGTSPLCESYLEAGQLNRVEPFFPLRVYVCDCCYLVQLEEYVSPEQIFTEYAYFSSYSDSWLEHAKTYSDNIANRVGLGTRSQVIELGSNDGYLLQYFVAKGIPTLGVEPAANVARAAIERGVPTRVQFFGVESARDLVLAGKQADLVIANNVLAQVPDLNDFVAGMKLLLKPTGVATIEVPHLVKLIEGNQFDTIYHEHFSYFSFGTLDKIFAACGLCVFDVEELPTHGGSLRIYVCHSEDSSKPISPGVTELKAKEDNLGMHSAEYYAAFGEKVKELKWKLLEFLIAIKRAGKTIVGYGAPGKANTLLNYCGIRQDFLDYTADRNPYKQGKFTPGTHIPIHHPDKILETKPDYILILPWNIQDEIMQQLDYVRKWGARFVVSIPEVKIYS